MSPRLAPVLSGLVLSALMSCLVSGISVFRNAGLVDGFFNLWIGAWLPTCLVAFPVVLLVAPLAGRLVRLLSQAPASGSR